MVPEQLQYSQLGLSDEVKATLCPVRALAYYVDWTRGWRQTEQLLICCGSKFHGQTLSKQQLSKWIAATVRVVTDLANLPPPLVIPQEALQPLGIHTFTRFYRLNALDPLVLGPEC
ncbi:UNVERIFIED_CONTAM: hypothetical protein FKN15_010022 [Acipenser sinensis]